MLLIFFYSIYFIFHICLLLIPNYFVSFFSFMVILLLLLLPSSFYQPLFSCFLHFLDCKFAFLTAPFIFKCFCTFILFHKPLFGFLGYCFNVFPFFINVIVNTTFIVQIFQYFKLIINFYSIVLFPFWILKKYSQFVFPPLYLFPGFTLNFTLKFIFSKLCSDVVLHS